MLVSEARTAGLVERVEQPTFVDIGREIEHLEIKFLPDDGRDGETLSEIAGETAQPAAHDVANRIGEIDSPLPFIARLFQPARFREVAHDLLEKERITAGLRMELPREPIGAPGRLAARDAREQLGDLIGIQSRN